jgi:hypothetical protein
MFRFLFLIDDYKLVVAPQSINLFSEIQRIFLKRIMRKNSDNCMMIVLICELALNSLSCFNLEPTSAPKSVFLDASDLLLSRVFFEPNAILGISNPIAVIQIIFNAF